jgi:V8-like Glu-specific endopeptidase
VRATRRELRAVALALLIAACDPGAPGSVRAPILGGAIDDATRAVVYLESAVGNCSGILISPRVVLTARHCVQRSGADAPMHPSTFTVGVGTTFEPFTAWAPRYGVVRVAAVPGVWTDSIVRGEDLGLLVLEEPLDVEPLAIRRDPPVALLGSDVTAIGYSLTEDGSTTATRHVGTARLDVVTSTVLVTTGLTCVGDSGGPLLEETPVRRVIGVTSFGTTSTCETTTGNGFNRIDLHLDLIDRIVVEAGDCVPRGAELCNSVDDDCDGAVDETCTPFGGACAADAECALAQVPGFLPPRSDASRCIEGVCTRPCAIGASCEVTRAHHGSEVVWPGASCVIDAACGGTCSDRARGPSGIGAACSRDDECSSARCVDPGDGTRRCVAPCVGDHGDCAVGEACVAAPGACGSCVDAAVLRAVRHLGEPCTEAAECSGVICRAEGPDAYCSRPCATDGECTSAFHCARGICTRGARAAVGEPCFDTEDCAAGTACVTRGDERWCSATCASDDACPVDFTCDARAAVCAPSLGIAGAPCTADGECTSGACRHGSCTVDCRGGAACPVGLACVRERDGLAAWCLRERPPPPVSTCTSTPTRGDGGLVLALAAILALGRARGRRAPTGREHGEP